MILVAMPAYNETHYIKNMVTEVKKYSDAVLVVDDGSSDDTAKVASLAGATVMSHETNLGYGATIITILKEARRSDCDVLVIIDADTQHDPKDIPCLVQPILEGYDLVIGARKRKDIPVYRYIGGKVLSIFTRILSGANVSDSQSGFRAYSRKAVEKLYPKERGMAVSSEIISEATKNRLKITEVPISIRYTDDSSTHNPIKQGFYTLYRIMVMSCRRIVEKLACYFLIQMIYILRCFTHRSRLKHIKNGRDWRFYEQYSAKEILKMKFDGTEESKYWVWVHRR